MPFIKKKKKERKKTIVWSTQSARQSSRPCLCNERRAGWMSQPVFLKETMTQTVYSSLYLSVTALSGCVLGQHRHLK